MVPADGAPVEAERGRYRWGGARGGPEGPNSSPEDAERASWAADQTWKRLTGLTAVHIRPLIGGGVMVTPSQLSAVSPRKLKASSSSAAPRP